MKYLKTFVNVFLINIFQYGFCMGVGWGGHPDTLP